MVCFNETANQMELPPPLTILNLSSPLMSTPIGINDRALEHKCEGFGLVSMPKIYKDLLFVQLNKDMAKIFTKALKKFIKTMKDV